MAPKSYKIIELESFNKDFVRLGKRINRLDEFITGAKEIISRKPELGKPTANKYTKAFKMVPLPNNPNLTLHYMYTEEQVILLFLRADGDPPVPPMVL